MPILFCQNVQKALHAAFFSSAVCILFNFILSFSAWSAAHPAPQTTTQQRSTTPFTQITIQGSINTVLHTAPKERIILQGKPDDLAHVYTKTRQGRLLMGFTGSYHPASSVTAHIYTKNISELRYQGYGILKGTLHSKSLALYLENAGTTDIGGNLALHRLMVKGSALVKIKGIHTNQLIFGLDGKPRVYLEGMIRLGTLDMRGTGFLSMYWVKGDRLNVRLRDKATLQLAGFVNTLELKASEHSHFMGRYLRARRAFIKTNDNAVAEINAIHHQHTLASGASDIKTYNLPDIQQNFMAHDGAVLDMRPWNAPYFEQETAYNNM